MLRFTIRDVFWLTVVVALLSLWAMERQTVNFDWSRVHENEGRLHTRIAEQTESIRRLNERFVAEQELRLEIERRLAEAEAGGP